MSVENGGNKSGANTNNKWASLEGYGPARTDIDYGDYDGSNEYWKNHPEETAEQPAQNKKDNYDPYEGYGPARTDIDYGDYDGSNEYWKNHPEETAEQEKEGKEAQEYLKEHPEIKEEMGGTAIKAEELAEEAEKSSEAGDENARNKAETEPDDKKAIEEIEEAIKKLAEEERKNLEKEPDDKKPGENPSENPADKPVEEVPGVKSTEKPKELDPLIAVNANLEHDAEAEAEDQAEKALNAELSSAKGISGRVKAIWKGQFFRKVYEQRYKKQFLNGERKLTDKNGKEITLSEYMQEQSSAALSRMELGAVNGATDIFVHTDAGEKLTEASEKLTADIKAAVEKYATGKPKEGENLEDLKNTFEEEINRARQEAIDRGEEGVDGITLDNYLKIAEAAKERVNHEWSIEQVMKGFKVYNAEIRDGVRTEAHRDAIDKIVNKFENTGLGKHIPPEIVAGAASTAWALTQSGTRAMAGPLGGTIVSGVFAGMRERNQVASDRRRMLRDLANGESYDGVDKNDGKNKRERYEADLAGTKYDCAKAEDLTAGINDAIEKGDHKALLQALAEAEVRRSLSDTESKDLISFSSSEKRGDERLQLDIAIAKAKKEFSEDDKKTFDSMKETIAEQIEDDISEKDKLAKKIANKQAAKQGLKTTLFAAGTMFASQEIVAAFDPTKIGILEKTGILKTENTNDAQETLLASITRGTYQEQIGSHTEIVDQQNDLTKEQAEALRAKGYDIDSTTVSTTETVNVSPKDAINKSHIKYDGWANNGTKISDGNELRVYGDGMKGFNSGMFGESTYANGTINYADQLSAGNIKGFITLGDGTKLEVVPSFNDAGQWTIGSGNGVYELAGGGTLQLSGPDAYKYVEVAVSNGVDSKGLEHIIPLATAVGNGESGGATVTQTIESAKELFTATKTAVVPELKTFVRDRWAGGIVFGAARRTNLGETTVPSEPTPNNNANTSPSETAPSGSNIVYSALRTPANVVSDQANTTGSTNGMESASVVRPAEQQPTQPAEVLATTQQASESVASQSGNNEQAGTTGEAEPNSGTAVPEFHNNFVNGLKPIDTVEHAITENDFDTHEDYLSARGNYSNWMKSIIEEGQRGKEQLTPDELKLITDEGIGSDEDFEKIFDKLTNKTKRAITINPNQMLSISQTNSLNDMRREGFVVMPWNSRFRIWLKNRGYKPDAKLNKSQLIKVSGNNY